MVIFFRWFGLARIEEKIPLSQNDFAPCGRLSNRMAERVGTLPMVSFS
jgi:hypothetical protein